MYGPTETTVYATCKHISDSDSIITVGKPIANTQVYILDQNSNHFLSLYRVSFISAVRGSLGYHNRAGVEPRNVSSNTLIR